MRKRDQKLAEFYRNGACAICGKTGQGVAGDHIKTFGSGGRCCHSNMASLCFDHHREKTDIGLTAFAKKYEQMEIVLKSKGWEFDEFSQKWLHRDNQKM